MLLRNPEIFPTNEVLKDALGDAVFCVLESFVETVTSENYGLTVEWRYYNDGKSWLGKVTYKQKTVFWLSVWAGFLKTSFFFTEKHLEAIAALPVSTQIKEEFCSAKLIGRLIPMIIEINKVEDIPDLLTIIRFKKKLK